MDNTGKSTLVKSFRPHQGIILFNLIGMIEQLEREESERFRPHQGIILFNRYSIFKDLST